MSPGTDWDDCCSLTTLMDLPVDLANALAVDFLTHLKTCPLDDLPAAIMGNGSNRLFQFGMYFAHRSKVTEKSICLDYRVHHHSPSP